MAILIISVIIWIILESITNYGIIKQNSTIWHRCQAAVRSLLAFDLCTFKLGYTYDSIIMFFLVLCYFWITFDIVLNLSRKIAWDFVGNTADTDILLQWIAKKTGIKVGTAMVITKTIVLCFFTLLLEFDKDIIKWLNL